MVEVIDYVQAHWLEITAIAAATLVLAERIAQLTPTDADNKVIAMLGKVLSVVALKKP